MSMIVPVRCAPNARLGVEGKDRNGKETPAHPFPGEPSATSEDDAQPDGPRKTGGGGSRREGDAALHGFDIGQVLRKSQKEALGGTSDER
jgi:hypothetical protein